MKKILIIYDTVEGQTKKIAEAICLHIRDQGYAANLSTPQKFRGSLDDYDGVIVGGPVHMQRFPKNLRYWIFQNAGELTLMPSAFFSVCLGILQKEDPKVQEEERKIAEDFLAKSRWTPGLVGILAGSLAYTKYNWPTKILMKWIARKAGGSVDTSKDHEYTDWNEVRQFVYSFLNLLENNKNIYDHDLDRAVELSHL